MTGLIGEARVLLVEDHAPFRAAIQDILEAEGYTVLVAMDGLHALELLSNMQGENLPHLILSDISMPRLDGYGLCRAIRERAEWAVLPFVFMTASPELMTTVCKMYALDCITKPFAPQYLLAVVAKHMRVEIGAQMQGEEPMDEYEEEGLYVSKAII